MVNPPPLNTALISLLCYYDHGSPLTKADFLDAFQSYTEYDNYVDGIIYVWANGYTGPASPREGDKWTGHEGPGSWGDDKLEVHIRLRTDGWILAYILRTQEYGKVTWWNCYPEASTTEPPEYSTRLARAIYLLLLEAGLSGGFSYETSVGYFDYEYPTATKLYMVGQITYLNATAPPGWSVLDQWYHTIPAGITMRRALLVYTYYWASNSYSRWAQIWLKYDTTTIHFSDTFWGGYRILGGWNSAWLSTHVYDVLILMTLGIQHYIRWEYAWDNAGNLNWLTGRTNLVIVTD